MYNKVVKHSCLWMGVGLWTPEEMGTNRLFHRILFLPVQDFAVYNTGSLNAKALQTQSFKWVYCLHNYYYVRAQYTCRLHNYSYIRYLENMHYGFSALHRCVQQPTYLD